jgi:hypothetical protein
MTDNILFKSFIDKIVTLKDDLFNKKNQIKKKDLIIPAKTEKQKIKLYIPEIRISNNNQRDSIKSNQTIQFTIKKKIKPIINLDSSKIIPSVKSVKNILSTNLTTNECEPNNNSSNKETNDVKKIIFKKNIEKENLENKNQSDLNLKENIEDDELLISEDSNLICEYEKNKIKFTKNGLFEFFNKLFNLTDFKGLWNNDNLKIEIRNEGTPLTNEFYLIKTTYTQKKSELGLNNLIENQLIFTYNPKFRKMWDQIIKEIIIYEGNDKNYIVLSWANSPCFLMSERYTIEKRFIVKKNNETLIFSTSVPYNYKNCDIDAIKIISFCNLVKIFEDNDNIYYQCLNQNDYKMTIPQFIINITLPLTSKNLYINLQKFSFKYKLENNEVKELNEEEIKNLL